MIRMWRLWRSTKPTPTTRLTAVGVTAMCVISLTTALVARADSIEERKERAEERVATLGQQLEGTNEALADAYVKVRRANAAIPVAEQRLAKARAAQARAAAAQVQAQATEARAVSAEARARAHNEAVAQRLAVAQANEKSAEAKLSSSGAALVTSQDALDAYAAEVFQGGGGSESQLGIVFGSTSPQDFADRLVMADTASAVASDTIDRLATITADTTATEAYLTSVRAEVVELKRQAEASLKAAEAAAAAAARAREQAVIARNNAVVATQNAARATTDLRQLKARQQGYAADLRTQRAREKQLLAAAQAEAQQLRSILWQRALKAKRDARANGKNPNTSTPSNYLSYPANGPVTSGFGMRWHPVLQVWMLHDGLDLGIGCGTPVYASAPGEVIRAGWRASGWGNQVVIDHGIHRGIDLVTTYNHLSSIVKYGGQVQRGQLIGYSGTTGYSTGCHLHFGVYEDGTPVNPRRWL